MTVARARRRLAKELVGRSRKEANRTTINHQLADVIRLKPLTIELYEQDGHLVEGDDFVVGQWVMAYRRSRGIKTSDNFVMQRHSGHWVAVDVVTDGEVAFKVKEVNEDPDQEGKEGDGPDADAPVVGGLRYTYQGTLAEEDPGSGNIAFNGAFNKLFISETDADGKGSVSFLNIWDDSGSTPRGYIFMRNLDVGSARSIWTITGEQTDSGAWRVIPIGLNSAVGASTKGDSFAISFYPM